MLHIWLLPHHARSLPPASAGCGRLRAGFGAEKYAPFNYLKGYPWSLSFNAATRHAFAMWNGEDLDPESGLPHAAHFAWHGLTLTSFYLRGLGTDDRFKQEPPSGLERLHLGYAINTL